MTLATVFVFALPSIGFARSHDDDVSVDWSSKKEIVFMETRSPKLEDFDLGNERKYKHGDHDRKKCDVSPVPVPPTLWLFGSGLAGLITVVRRRRHR